VGGDIPLSWKHVLNWAGLRGAISLALALSLPLELGTEAIEAIQVMAFGVVLFTLLVQGFTVAPLVRFLKLVERSPAQDEYERRHARAVANRMAYEHLKRRNRQGLLSDHAWKALAPVLEEHNEILANSVREVVATAPEVEEEELDTARREALRAQRSALRSLLRDGVISNEIYTQLVAEVDSALAGEYTGWHELIGPGSLNRVNVNRLMMVMVQEQDVENAVSALTKLGVTITTLPSTGGYLSRRNSTLVIGLSSGQEEAIVQSLRQSCRERAEYLTPPLESSLAYANPIPVTVGGATIFTYEVERFEVF
jgi:uncharacterized protein YaaQ